MGDVGVERLERTVLCFTTVESVERETEVRELLSEKYGLVVKRRTETELSEEKIKQFTAQVRDFREQAHEEKLMAEEEERQRLADLERKEEEEAAVSGKKKNAKKETKTTEPIDDEDATQINEQERQRQKGLSEDEIMLSNALLGTELVVLSFLGVNSVSVLKTAFENDEALRELFNMKQPVDTEPEEKTDIKEDEDEAKQTEVPSPCIEDILGRFNAVYPFSTHSNHYFVEFFFKPPNMAEIDFDNELGARNNKVHRSTKSDRVDLEKVMQFMFPKTQQHPSSTGRMLLFGEYGPLDENGCLRSGMKGQHVLNKHEINSLVRDINRDDLLYIYVKNDILSPDEQLEVVKQADPRIAYDKQITKQQVIALFENLNRDKNGRLCFHEMQQIIFNFRADRVERWKQMAANSVRKKTKPSKFEQEERRRHQRALKIASKVSLRKEGQIDDNDAFLKTSKLLNKHTFQICDIKEKNHPSIVQNVRILRNARSVAQEHGAVAWKS